jgi:DNA-binding PadR family transcriptional regulator
MANKKTVVQMFEEIKAMPGLTAEQIAFLEKRIEITQKKNANRSTEPTHKQKEKMAHDAELRGKIVAVMVEGATYTPSDLIKLVDIAEIPNTQKITPMLTPLVADGVLTKTTVKGQSVYSLSAENADEVED